MRNSRLAMLSLPVVFVFGSMANARAVLSAWTSSKHTAKNGCRSLHSLNPHRALTILIAALACAIFAWPAYGSDEVTFFNQALTLTQTGCVTVLGGNCAQVISNSGTYSSPSGASSASTSPPAATGSAMGPNGEGGTFFNSAAANATGAFSTTTSSTGGTLSAIGNITANANQTSEFNGVPTIINASGSATSVFFADVTISSPMFYFLSFSGAPPHQAGSTSTSTSLFTSISPGFSNASGTISVSGTLAAGTYFLQGDVFGDASTCSGCNVAVFDQYSLSLTLSSTPIPSVAVPNVVGLTQVEATTAITGVGLTLGTVTAQSSATVGAGIVVSEIPSADAIVASNSGVNIVVSIGPASQVSVPTLVGLTQAGASSAITSAGLVVGTISTQSSSTVPAGSVISQSPTAGTGVPSGGPVNLVVSSGPATISIVLGGAPVITSSGSGWSVTVLLENTGTVSATVNESAATLGGVAASRGAVSSITLAPGAAGSLVLSFPSNAGAAGAAVALSVSGSYSATSLSGNWTVGARARLP
jgi:PASTA domain